MSKKNTKKLKTRKFALKSYKYKYLVTCNDAKHVEIKAYQFKILWSIRRESLSNDSLRQNDRLMSQKMSPKSYWVDYVRLYFNQKIEYR